MSDKLTVQLQEIVASSGITNKDELTKAAAIAANYAPLMNEVSEIGEKIKKLVKDNPGDLKLARRYKLDLGKTCSKATEQKKIDKQDILLQTKFIDALFNTVNGAARLNQEEAKQIELHHENIEKEAKEKLFKIRVNLLTPFLDDNSIIPDFIGEMTEEIWNSYFLGIQTNFNLKIEIAKNTEKAEIEKAEKDQIESNRKDIAYDFKPYWTNNTDFRNMSEKDFQAEIKIWQKAKKIADDKQKAIAIENAKLKKEAEQIAAEAKIAADKLKAINDAAAKIAAEAANEAQVQLKFKQKLIDEAAAKIIEDKQKEIAEKERNLAKDDEAKLQDFIKDLQNLGAKYSFTAEQNIKLYSQINVKFTSIINYINTL